MGAPTVIIIGFRQFFAIIAVVALIAFTIGLLAESSTTRPLGLAPAHPVSSQQTGVVTSDPW